MKVSYFDHNATTPVTPKHWQRVWQEMGANAANASSPHSLGRNAHVALTQARTSVAQALGFEVSEIIFTSGGSEANTSASLGVLEERNREDKMLKMHVICSAFEHPCVLEPLRHAEKVLAVEVTYLSPSQAGSFLVDDIIAAIKPNTVLISLMAANNETGLLLPIQEFGNWLHEARWTKNFQDPRLCSSVTLENLRNLHFHSDLVQAFGKIPLENWSTLGIDSLAICAHKLGGLPGVGALALRRGRRFVPRVLGGPQEKYRRAGTENLPGIVSLGLIASDTLTDTWKQAWRELEILKNRLRSELAAIPELTKILDDSALCLPNTLNYFMDPSFMETVDLVMELDIQGFCLSTGSACSSGVNKASPFMLAMGKTARVAKNTLRLSLGLGNTAAEVAALSEKLRHLLQRQSKTAPISSSGLT